MPIVTGTLEDLPPLDEERINRLKKMPDKGIDVSDYRPVKVPAKSPIF